MRTKANIGTLKFTFLCLVVCFSLWCYSCCCFFCPISQKLALIILVHVCWYHFQHELVLDFYFFCSDSWSRGPTPYSQYEHSFIYPCHSKEAFQFKIQFLDKERCMGWYLWKVLLHSRYSPWWLSRFASTSLIFTSIFSILGTLLW